MSFLFLEQSQNGVGVFVKDPHVICRSDSGTRTATSNFRPGQQTAAKANGRGGGRSVHCMGSHSRYSELGERAPRPGALALPLPFCRDSLRIEGADAGESFALLAQVDVGSGSNQNLHREWCRLLGCWAGSRWPAEHPRQNEAMSKLLQLMMIVILLLSKCFDVRPRWVVQANQAAFVH